VPLRPLPEATLQPDRDRRRMTHIEGDPRLKGAARRTGVACGDFLIRASLREPVGAACGCPLGGEKYQKPGRASGWERWLDLLQGRTLEEPHRSARKATGAVARDGGDINGGAVR